MSSRTYGNLIWTNHALDRLEQRKLDQATAYTAYQYPDQTQAGREPGSVEYRRRIEKSLITMITKKNDRGEVIVLSCWIDPPLAGTRDAYQKSEWRKYQKASGWMKWLLAFKRQLGL